MGFDDFPESEISFMKIWNKMEAQNTALEHSSLDKEKRLKDLLRATR